jgi:hypothetical protein
LTIAREASTIPATIVEQWGSGVIELDNVAGSGDFGFPPSAEGGLIYIEQLSACVKNPPHLIGKNDTAKVAVIFKPRCKSWYCPGCAKLNKNLWVMRTYKAAEELIGQGIALSMVTITGHEKHSLEYAVACYPNQWNKLQNRWRRKVGNPYYAMFPEIAPETGHFHVHMLTDKWADERFWKDNARRSGMGYMADEGDHNIPPKKAAFYASKYLGKQLGTQWEKGFRRVRTSQNWPKLPPLPRDENWQFSPLDTHTPLSHIVEQLNDLGYRVALADGRSAWTIVDAC